MRAVALAHLDVAAEPGIAVDVELEVVVVALDGDGLVGGICGRRGGLGRRGARRWRPWASGQGGSSATRGSDAAAAKVRGRESRP